MGSTRCSGGSNYSGLSSSSSSYSSTTCSSSSCTAMATDQMVKVEMEAAEALADLACFAMRHNTERAKKQVKIESPTCDLLSLPSQSDLNHRLEDRVVVSQKDTEKEWQNQMSKLVNSEWEPTKKIIKDDKEVESVKPSPTSNSSYPLFGCRRSSRYLTEAEKEERRVRRILANRESARQTIRRRQALCEELTKRAADLAWENENLKREKELALKEYHSLETTNKHLKEQMAQAVKPEVEEIPGNNRSSPVQMPPLSSNYPLFLYSHPAFAPYFWPSVVQSSTPYQSQHEVHNVVVIPSSFQFPGNNGVSVSETSHEQENFTNINGPKAPFCMLPCSWVLPHPDHRNQFNPQISISMENNQKKVSLNSQSSAHEDTQDSCFLSVEEKREVPNSNDASNSKDNRTHAAVGVVLDGVDVAQVSKMISPVKLECFRPTSTAKENRSEEDHSPSSRACQNSCVFPEKNYEPEILHSKKIVGAVAAAEARKRRKELTKLKNLHGRQCRTHY